MWRLPHACRHTLMAQSTLKPSANYLAVRVTTDLGEMLDLQATYWRVQSDALMGQAEELRALTTKAAADMAGPFDARVPSSIYDMRKAS